MKFNSQSGLSLIELMIVVAIIGILAALAIPRFQGFQARARQDEGKSNLNHIYTLEQSYHGDNDTYAVIPAMGQAITTGTADTTAIGNCNIDNVLGFRVTDCTKVRYQYQTNAFDAVSFTAQASSLANGDNQVFPGCATADVWTMDDQKTLANPSPGTTACL